MLKLFVIDKSLHPDGRRIGGHRDEVRLSISLLWLIPLFQTGLDFLTSLFGRH
jgi:hypothetical protein